jgi:7,8-dihydro-6-hydroxymethylpterin dimethyltransferase
MIRGLAYGAVRGAANAAWGGFQWVNRRIPARTFQPAWSSEALPKSHERTKPPLGFPRRTDSLCPTCTREVRDAIIRGETDLKELIEGHPGEIPADIVRRGDEIWMEKSCPKHGFFEDLISTDARFFARLEENFFGRDVRIGKDSLHDHGSAAIRYGRGAVLTVDLTNRCNMMCNPCFMDANQVGYVHELDWPDVKQILDNAVSVKPRRQMSVQFSGGEPTISPWFLDATRYAREVGYFSVQCASNGIRFAQEPEFARAAYEAGLRLVYLQFDGVGNENNDHRNVSNLFDVKLRALDNLKAAGIDVTLVITIVNGINNHQVGDIIRFAIENIDKINALSFQPVSFTGRDEEVDDATRRAQRYTLSHLAVDVKAQAGIGEPLRDWYPLSASGPFSDLRDLLGGLDAEWGSLKCGCHPNCGIATMLLVRPDTGQAVPVSEVLEVDRLLRDFQLITDSARGRFWTVLQAALSVARNIRPGALPENLGVLETLKVMDGHTGKSMGIASSGRYPWRVLLVAGMWFQDLFNYDFRRTEMCIIPYGTQLGEISFCAYNTGAGWRKIIEEMYQTATLQEWYKSRGRHPVYSGGKAIPLPTYRPSPDSRPEETPLPAAARTGAAFGLPLPAFGANGIGGK